ncbi:multispanning membrane [Podospora fimiseda]|uniref:Transmembrane 9 superfamily member n=1 Tax=Podospora fimiseda TaxID=252190 RepID=A0AAN7BLE7_9PEZI|nr:multispanning membrane [Podospora fimiseda]
MHSHLPLLASLLLSPALAFYIPFFSIHSYPSSAPIPLLVNKVYSDTSQLQYAYYDLPFVCPRPTSRPLGTSGLFSGQNIPLNLGEVLRGDRITASDMSLRMGQDNECSVLCSREVNQKDLKRARDLIREGYVVEWIVDNLPGATSFVTVDKTKKYYAAGFKLGSSSVDGGKRVYLNNHFTIVIRYRSAQGKKGAERGEKVVVGFEVYPKSIGVKNVERDDKGIGCPVDLGSKGREKFELPVVEDEEERGENNGTMMTIPYTYSVYFREDNSIEWSKRWDLYFVNQEEGAKIHWMAIVNSLAICGVLTGVVLMILARTVRNDIKGYLDGEKGRKRKVVVVMMKEKVPGLSDQGDEVEGIDEDEEEEGVEDVTGWKLLHADVFRTPRNGHLLAPLVGSGMQLLFMAVGLVLLGALGILSPSFRGGFISFGVGLFVFAGVLSGYFSSRVYKTFGGRDWSRNTVVTATLFPGLLFSIIFVLNLFVWAQASSTALPFGTLIAMVFLWLCVQVPLVYAGAWYGFVKAGSWEYPTKTSSIPRQIPQQAWYIKGLRMALLAGLIPFAVIFIELLFVFQSVWQDKSGYYYVFGFLAVVSTILILTIAEVTVLAIYVQLCSENYNWWWSSFMVGGGSAVWVFAYCTWYYFAKLHITGFLSSILFFSYSFMACCVYGLLTGTVGFLTAFAFVRRIYGAIKAD